MYIYMHVYIYIDTCRGYIHIYMHIYMYIDTRRGRDRDTEQKHTCASNSKTKEDKREGHLIKIKQFKRRRHKLAPPY